MTTSHVEYPRVISRTEWLSARREFLLKEKEFTRLRDQVSAERRRLPMVKIDKDYVLEGPDGNVPLRHLFTAVASSSSTTSCSTRAGSRAARAARSWWTASAI